MKLFAIFSLLAVASAAMPDANPVAAFDADVVHAAGRGKAFIEGQRGLFGTGTCSGSCNSQASDNSCWCDNLCTGYGDCCSDAGSFCPALSTCANSCGAVASTPGSMCFCDDVCTGLGDCCDDAGSFCPQVTTCSGACGGVTMTPGATCYCDEACITYNDCCADAISTCPFSVPTNSCHEKCGGASEDYSCWCDSVCTEMGDCCSDFTDDCPNTRRNLATDEFEAAMKHRELGAATRAAKPASRSAGIRASRTAGATSRTAPAASRTAGARTAPAHASRTAPAHASRTAPAASRAASGRDYHSRTAPAASRTARGGAV